ncbi:MAG: hypothetical protein PHC36_00040 [Eubacteriales bacterium]|nr:hypothetical protein [Eubacteriales bacterium]
MIIPVSPAAFASAFVSVFMASRVDTRAVYTCNDTAIEQIDNAAAISFAVIGKEKIHKIDTLACRMIHGKAIQWFSEQKPFVFDWCSCVVIVPVGTNLKTLQQPIGSIAIGIFVDKMVPGYLLISKERRRFF